MHTNFMIQDKVNEARIEHNEEEWQQTQQREAINNTDDGNKENIDNINNAITDEEKQQVNVNNNHHQQSQIYNGSFNNLIGFNLLNAPQLIAPQLFNIQQPLLTANLMCQQQQIIPFSGQNQPINNNNADGQSAQNDMQQNKNGPYGNNGQQNGNSDFNNNNNNNNKQAGVHDVPMGSRNNQQINNNQNNNMGQMQHQHNNMNQQPNAQLTDIPPTTKVGEMATFDASKSHDYQNKPCEMFIFDFGDGTIPFLSKSPKVTHVYKQRGTYPVTVDATDEYGQKATAAVTHHVTDPELPDPTDPIANVTSTPSEAKVNESRSGFQQNNDNNNNGNQSSQSTSNPLFADNNINESTQNVTNNNSNSNQSRPRSLLSIQSDSDKENDENDEFESYIEINKIKPEIPVIPKHQRKKPQSSEDMLIMDNEIPHEVVEELHNVRKTIKATKCPLTQLTVSQLKKQGEPIIFNKGCQPKIHFYALNPLPTAYKHDIALASKRRNQNSIDLRNEAVCVREPFHCYVAGCSKPIDSNILTYCKEKLEKERVNSINSSKKNAIE